VRFIEQDDQVAVLHALIDAVGVGPVFLAGISFGGIIARRYAIDHGDTLAGLVPMSTFADLSPQLGFIRLPTMILNGEFDFLMPRPLHETLRTHIPDSALVIVPRGYHAFTLEKPEQTAWLPGCFAHDVLADCWKGVGTVCLAPEQAGGTMTTFPAEFDHLRAIPVRRDKPKKRSHT
jgi:pimeloyl-ACP methyl ester carboxylesterase